MASKKTKSIFEGIGKQGAQGSRRPFLEQEGTHTAEIQTLKYLLTREQTHLVILEYKITESSADDLVGSELVCFFWLSGKGMDVGKSQLNTFMLAASKIEGGTAAAEEALDEMEDRIEAAIDDEQPLRGGLVGLRSVHKEVGNKTFTNVYWNVAN